MISPMTASAARAFGLRLPSMSRLAWRSLQRARCARLSPGLSGHSARTTVPNLHDCSAKCFDRRDLDGFDSPMTQPLRSTSASRPVAGRASYQSPDAKFARKSLILADKLHVPYLGRQYVHKNDVYGPRGMWLGEPSTLVEGAGNGNGSSLPAASCGNPDWFRPQERIHRDGIAGNFVQAFCQAQRRVFPPGEDVAQMRRRAIRLGGKTIDGHSVGFYPENHWMQV